MLSIYDVLFSDGKGVSVVGPRQIYTVHFIKAVHVYNHNNIYDIIYNDNAL